MILINHIYIIEFNTFDSTIILPILYSNKYLFSLIYSIHISKLQNIFSQYVSIVVLKIIFVPFSPSFNLTKWNKYISVIVSYHILVKGLMKMINETLSLVINHIAFF